MQRARRPRGFISGWCIEHVGQSLEEIIAGLLPLGRCNGCCKPFKAVHLHPFFLFRCCFFLPPHREKESSRAPPESECSSTRRLQAKGLNNSLWPEAKKEALPGSVCCRRFNDLGYTRGVTSRGQSVQTTLRERMTPRFCWLPHLLTRHCVAVLKPARLAKLWRRSLSWGTHAF
jgi:hypothetical protein